MESDPGIRAYVFKFPLKGKAYFHLIPKAIDTAL
jgi:hypothetical protein